MTPSETPIPQLEMIAKFMGVPKLMDYKGDLWDYQRTGKEIYCVRTNELRYNSSFDWLMPVFEKINSLGVYTVVHIDANYVNVHLSKDQEFIQIPYVYENLKDSLFKGVCIAVEYLMKNKPLS